MSTELQKAKDVLFSDQGLRASNFKLFPGSSRDATAEQVAHEIRRSIENIAAGNFEVIDSFDD